MIVDAQVHLWKANTPDRPWLPGRVAQLPEPFLIEKLVPMMDEAGVDRAVIVPPSWEGDRNDYALEAVRRYPTRFAVMGRIPITDPKTQSSFRIGKSSRACSASGSRFIRRNGPGSPTAPPIGSGRWRRSISLPVMFYGAPMPISRASPNGTRN